LGGGIAGGCLGSKTKADMGRTCGEKWGEDKFVLNDEHQFCCDKGQSRTTLRNTLDGRTTAITRNKDRFICRVLRERRPKGGRRRKNTAA